MDYFTYLTTFENGQFGYGAALAVLLFLIVLVLTIVQMKLFPQARSAGSLSMTTAAPAAPWSSSGCAWSASRPCTRSSSWR